MKKTALILVMIVLPLFSGCKWVKDWFGTEKKEKFIEEKYVINIENEDEFKKNILDSKLPVVVKFETKWCGICRSIALIYSELAKKYNNEMKFATVNISKIGEIAKKYEITGVPIFLFFKDGKIVGRIEGGVEVNVLENKIVEVLK
ncbi:thioredoxin family protein [Candidatus Babeliales bacterium]|nr:thioredoxin family protein [Candidatus Babeliales bacterium]